MNSSTLRIPYIIIDSSIITLSLGSICISAGIFIFITYHLIKKRNSPNRVALILAANVYLAILISCILLLAQYIRAFQGHIYSLISLNDGIYCQLRAYFLEVSISGVYYSNSLQAIFRLCRVVFYTRKSLQSFRLYQILIIIQWMICFLIMIPALLFGHFKYLVNDYYCQIEYTDLRSMTSNGTLIYGIPVYTTVGCYLYTLRKTRRENHGLMHTMTQIQRISARRDLIVLSRICILLGLLLSVFIPSLITLFIYNLTGYLPWWSYQTDCIVFSLSFISVTISLAIVFPHVRNLWTANHHHHHHQNHAVVVPVVIRVN